MPGAEQYYNPDVDPKEAEAAIGSPSQMQDMYWPNGDELRLTLFPQPTENDEGTDDGHHGDCELRSSNRHRQSQ